LIGAEPLPAHYFELYAIAVDMADRLSARRGTANGFFLTINTGLVALIGSATLRWYVAAAGIVCAATWWLLLRSYRRLSAAKFSVITEMERQLPAQIFSDEFQRYREMTPPSASPDALADPGSRVASWRFRHRDLGEVERVVPLVFAVVYAAEIVRQLAL